MSYCRWSSDDYQCDVYCYEDVSGGFTTMVANNRPVLNIELLPVVPCDDAHKEAWIARYNAVNAWVDGAERRKIGLPHDGENFHDPDAESAANRLQMLKDMGYNVPQYAIDALRAETADRIDY